VAAGILGAKQDFESLDELAEEAEATSSEPEVYAVLKNWAQAEQAAGWMAPGTATLDHLTTLGAQREVIGSAHANAWLAALGNALPAEVIVLPMEEAKSTQRSAAPVRPVAALSPMLLDAYPNPTDGPQWLVYRMPEGSGDAVLVVRDALGREVLKQAVPSTIGILELATHSWANGLYNATVVVDGIAAQVTKLLVQH